MNKIRLSFISCLLLLAINTNLQAQCAWTTQAAGAWTDAATWTNDGGAGCGVATTPPADIPSGTTVTINHAMITSSTDIRVQSGATLNLNSGSYLHITSGGLIINSGAVLNVNHAAIELEHSTSYLRNDGTVNVTKCFVIPVGIFHNNAGGIYEAADPAGIWTISGDVLNVSTWDTNLAWCEEGGSQSGGETKTIKLMLLK